MENSLGSGVILLHKSKVLSKVRFVFCVFPEDTLYKINLTESVEHPHIELVVAEPNCNAVDSLSVDHMVLVCQLGSASYVVEVTGSYSKEKGKWVFVKGQPSYHMNYFNDLECNTNYFMVHSHKTLNVYWSAKNNNIPDTVDTRSQLDLLGLETFFL